MYAYLGTESSRSNRDKHTVTAQPPEADNFGHHAVKQQAPHVLTPSTHYFNDSDRSDTSCYSSKHCAALNAAWHPRNSVHSAGRQLPASQLPETHTATWQAACHPHLILPQARSSTSSSRITCRAAKQRACRITCMGFILHMCTALSGCCNVH